MLWITTTAASRTARASRKPESIFYFVGRVHYRTPAVNAVDKDRNTALHMLAQSENPTLEMVKLLTNHGAKTNIRNNDGKTALDIAKEKDFGEGIKRLLR